jgi:replicative superfamily II helicase
MLVNTDTLRTIDNHWSVLTIGADKRDRVLEVAKARLVRSALGRQLTLDFKDRADDTKWLERFALAYELAAIEGLEAVLHPAADEVGDKLRQQCHAGAWRAFELSRLMQVPDQTDEMIQHVLHLSALAYCGDRWSDLRRWFEENQEAIVPPSVAAVQWDRRILYRLYGCWLRLFRKRSWDDLDRVREIIAGLREDQREYESGVLNNGDNSKDRNMAIHLVSLYHWAKATELLAVYMLQGTPAGIMEELDKHFEAACKAAGTAQDATLEVIQRWLHVAARRMAAGSVWRVAQNVNARVTKFVRSITKQAMFELLPPQRAALQEQGLLDQASRAVVVDLPTSGGKTLLAEFRILQALNQFDQDQGWVAYVAPTRALVAQITRRLRRDFSPFGVNVEQLTGAIEIDTFEDSMLTASGAQKTFDVLVCTPEKLQLVIRNKKVSRPLALLVLDEAHNMESKDRGLRIELLLSTVRQECEKSNFLLLMPDVPNAKELAQWLAGEAGAGRTISIGTSVWKPNERIVGLYDTRPSKGKGNWTLHYETLVTTPKVMQLKGEHQVGGVRPSGISWSASKGLSAKTAAMAGIFSERGTSIAVGDSPRVAWSMAQQLARDLKPLPKISNEIALVQRFLKMEIAPEFALVGLLDYGIGVHHAGLSDEARSLVEWLAEEGQLRVLCATSTIAQGINFPVSSVFLQSLSHYIPGRGRENMVHREFWNLAGRAGRFGHDSVGVIGIATDGLAKSNETKKYVAEATESLVSQLIRLLDQVEDEGKLNNLKLVIQEEQWRDFRCFVTHLWAEKMDLQKVLADTEQLLRSTYGYGKLRSQNDPSSSRKADALLKATKEYVQEIAQHKENAGLADSTGFAPEGVRAAMLGLSQLTHKLTATDWEPESLFGSKNTALSSLIGVMMRIPELRRSLEDISLPGKEQKYIADIAKAWVQGKSIQEIATKYFLEDGGNLTDALTSTCKTIYRTLSNSGAWGLAALSKMPTSGINFDKLPDDVRRRLNTLPSMIYHGVRTEQAVLMRMNSVPRSIAESLGERFGKAVQTQEQNVGRAREFIRSLSDQEWTAVLPQKAPMSGPDCRDVWQILSGEKR